MNFSIQKGPSFKETLDYVTHDKTGGGCERVGETETVNLVSSLPQAHKEMQTTVDAARAIQARARAERGEREASTGSRSRKNCLHYSLSWHPDDNPTPEHMMATARKTLDVLGLTEHQTVIVQHIDKPHAHLHVVCNLVHPETGRAHSLYRDVYQLDRWAHEYEKGQEMIRSFRREAKHERQAEQAKGPNLKRPEPTKEPDRQKQAKPSRNDHANRIREAQRREETKIRDRHAQQKAARQKEVDDLRDRYATLKRNLQDKHRAELNAHWRKPAHNLDLKPGKEFLRDDSKDWQKDAEALKPYLQRSGPKKPERVDMEHRKDDAREMFKQAKESRAPLERDTAKDERSEVQRQFAEDHRFDRQDSAEHIKDRQSRELRNLAVEMQNTLEAIRQNHDKQRDAEKSDWDRFKTQSRELWADHRKQYGLPDRPSHTHEAKQEEPAQEHRPEPTVESPPLPSYPEYQPSYEAEPFRPFVIEHDFGIGD